MNVFAKNGSKIEIYNMTADNERIKRYRQGVVSRNKGLKVTMLASNDREAMKHLENSTKIDEEDVVFDKPNFMDVTAWSDFYDDEVNPQTKEYVIRNYIEGKYDDKMPIEVVKTMYDESNRKWIEKPAYQMLLTDNKKISNGIGYIIKLNNIIMLPQNLFFLHCLLTGNLSRVVDENITCLLKLFDFAYEKSIDISYIREILNTGLVSGKISDIENKANIGDQVLRRAKVK